MQFYNLLGVKISQDILSFNEIKTILNKIKINQQGIRTADWTVSNCDDDLENFL